MRSFDDVAESGWSKRADSLSLKTRPSRSVYNYRSLPRACGRSYDSGFGRVFFMKISGTDGSAV